MIGSATVTGIVTIIQWLLNSDATPVIGKTYQWADTATWDDATGIWKD
jgi:hypothetical protein